MKLNSSQRAMLESWAATFASAALAVVMTNLESSTPLDLQDALVAGLVAVIPVIRRWLNRKDTQFGRTDS